ncbi:MAG: GNAT family N-acetyltransferase [Cyclobacteriaceae bacterium]|nr:GNAT family N-acetyltransferase [Cyclobacteriaceae bacterium]
MSSASPAVRPGTPSDLDRIFELYNQATLFQLSKGATPWQGFDRGMIIGEIDQHHLWKVVDNNTIAGIFSIAYEDLVWQHHSGSALYIHRIARNRHYHGAGLVPLIIDWCRQRALLNQCRYLRLDTFSANAALVEYYVRCGFTLKETFTVPETELRLPAHYRGASLALLEMALSH